MVRDPGSPTLSPTDFASAVTAITSAFGDPTRRRIFLLAQESADGVTAAEIAAAVALHPNVARHHLDKLAGGGYLEVTVGRAGTGAGRPSKRYRVTAQRVEVPVRHDDVLVTLLGRALTELGTDRATALAEEVGEAYGRVLATGIDPAADGARSVRVALVAAADALTAHGFAAHAEDSGGELRIVAEHCPFGDAAIAHPVICAVDRGMVRGLLSSLAGRGGAETLASIPMGDEVCITGVGP